MTDFPIPPGQGMAMYPDYIEGITSASGFSGLLVDGGGRLSLCIEGQGVRVTFAQPAALAALAMLLSEVAAALADNAEKAAADASADLARITASFPITARKFDA